MKPADIKKIVDEGFIVVRLLDTNEWYIALTSFQHSRDEFQFHKMRALLLDEKAISREYLNRVHNSNTKTPTEKNILVEELSFFDMEIHKDCKYILYSS